MDEGGEEDNSTGGNDGNEEKMRFPQKETKPAPGKLA